MLFFITDDDEAVRSMLAQIIEDEDLGEVAGEAEDGSLIDGHMLTLKNIDILLIDLLMPDQDGIETVRRIKPSFNGKIIMISQVESKEMIGEAYSLGIEYYITKPINRIEVSTIIRKVIEQTRVEKSIQDIYRSFNTMLKLDNSQDQPKKTFNEQQIRTSGQFLLAELGIAGEKGSKDLLDMLDYLYQYEQEQTLKNGIPALKEIFLKVVQKRLGKRAAESEIKKEVKASEQRVRRAIYQSLNHFASLGLTDFSNWKFENYASKFFDFASVRKKMTELEEDSASSTTLAGINTKKFIQVLYFEAKRVHLES
ncbi:DNA-binding domain-containing protein [Aneurinibacillus uraniidurans]|uniref:DNA-binding domain-containing protein n=1 Tax=Aneurinibacillus uraniidurans TaxID=2966586 RepID=UPI0023495049|nr:DNA-binding domain-containing protein [Aneurinibacillus sp. B1]WCN39431.1 DNA-binding domain-containing protein [Aneurinibacillus sp. B1]